MANTPFTIRTFSMTVIVPNDVVTSPYDILAMEVQDYLNEQLAIYNSDKTPDQIQLDPLARSYVSWQQTMGLSGTTMTAVVTTLPLTTVSDPTINELTTPSGG